MSEHKNDETLESLDFDLVVIGGGLAGLCAAIAAARHGAATALIQDRPVLGGNCSSEIRVVPHGSHQSNAWAAETGIVHELLLRDRHHNHEAFLDHGMINSIFDLTLLNAARTQANLSLFLNTSVRSVECSATSHGADGARASANGLGRVGGASGRIEAIRAFQMGSERAFRFSARQFLDATGDGTVGFQAGADFLYGRENRAEFQEPLAPLLSDEATLGATITIRAKKLSQPVRFDPPAEAHPYETLEQLGFARDIDRFHSEFYGGFWWLEICDPFHQIRDAAEIRDELHRHVLGVWDLIKNRSPLKEEAANYALDWVGMVPGKRESRRLLGDVILTEQHCHTDQAWPDAIGYAGWWIDLHVKGGLLNRTDPSERENVDQNYKHWIRAPVHGLPLRCFYSRNIDNLWMAGRCLSASHVGMGSVRVMQTLGHLGQAVGTAAAMAIANGLSPRELARPSGPWVKKLQQRLLTDDVRIPGVAADHEDDLARGARVTASSEAALDLSCLNGRWRELAGESVTSGPTPAIAMVVPLTEAHLRHVSLYLRNQSSEPRLCKLSLQSLSRIWDRVDTQSAVSSRIIELLPGDERWFEIDVDWAIDPGRPHRIVLEGERGVGWAYADEWPVGTLGQYLYVSPGGPEEKNANLKAFGNAEIELPPYRHWRQFPGALALRLDPQQRPFGGVNVISGQAWPCDLPHLWISDPKESLPQHIDVAFDQPRTMTEVQLSFDTNLARANQSSPGFFHAPECVRSWRLFAWEGDDWVLIFAETDNFLRKRTVRFPPIRTNRLRIEVLETNGAPEARIYELRAYA